MTNSPLTIFLNIPSGIWGFFYAACYFLCAEPLIVELFTMIQQDHLFLKHSLKQDDHPAMSLHGLCLKKVKLYSDEINLL